MRNVKAIRTSVRKTIGRFSKREFREAYAYALHKYRKNPHICEDWYLATVIGEIISQNRLSLYCETLYYMKRAVHAQET